MATIDLTLTDEATYQPALFVRSPVSHHRTPAGEMLDVAVVALAGLVVLGTDPVLTGRRRKLACLAWLAIAGARLLASVPRHLRTVGQRERDVRIYVTPIR